MSGESPVVNIFSSDGYESAVVNGAAIPANTRGYLLAGTDGTDARIILMDGSSRAIVAGAGVAGTPAGGVLSIQGVSDGTAVTEINAQTAETTAAWTSATAGNTTLALTVTGYGSVVVAINQGTTITGGAVTFEISDTVAGTNWYPVSTVTSFSALPSAAYVFVASTNVAFQLNVAGAIQFRARLSTVITGTATINIGITANAASAPIQQEQYSLLTDGANGPVAVKAPSVSALTTDPALVVAISPNNGSAGLLPVALGGPGTVDVFGQLTSAQRINQVSIPFFSAAPSSLITVTTTGSATATQGTGTGIFATGTTTASDVLGVTATSVTYSPHYEIYTAFTAEFTTGVASTYQRIGLYNTTDGFSFGYNGTTFGLWSRFNTADTFVAQTSWNIDKLSGATGSKFTSAGSPQALTTTNINIYRIRFGWLGIAPVIFEVMSPDGNWVIVHVLTYPNSQTTVHLTTPNLPMTVDVNNQGTTSGLTVTCGCWVAGSDAPATVKPPSATALSTDSSLVVAINPNSNNVQLDGTSSLGTEMTITGAITSSHTDLSVADIINGNKLDLIYQRLDDLFNLMVNDGIVTNEKTRVPRSYMTFQYTFAAATTSAIYFNTNHTRIGGTIVNDIASTSNLYLLLGASASNKVSATNYTILLVPNGYYEIPFGFAGRIDGVWSATVGNAYATEIVGANTW